MGFFSRVPSGVETKDASSQRAVATPLFAFGHPYVSNWSIQRAVRDGWERDVWLYRAVDAVAQNAARLPIVIRQGDPREGPIVDDLDVLRTFNRKANIWENSTEFRYRLSVQLLLSKAGVFVEAQPGNAAGTLANTYLLPPQYTQPIPDPDTYVSGYRVWVGGTTPVDVPPDNVAWIRKPHPTDAYSGTTPLEAAGLSIDMDFYSRLFSRTFLQNDGRPGGIVAVKGPMGVDDAAELQRRFSGGPNQAGRTTVVESDSVEYIDTSVAPRDMQYVQSREMTKSEILLAIGVPESIIGNAANRTYDNADAEKEIFWYETMLPHLTIVGGGYERLMQIAGLPDDYYVGFDVSSVHVLGREERARMVHYASMVNQGFMYLNEGRGRVGLPPLDMPQAKTIWLTAAVVPVGVEGAAEIAPDLATAEDARAAAAAAQRSVEAASAAAGEPVSTSSLSVPDIEAKTNGRFIMHHARKDLEVLDTSLRSAIESTKREGFTTTGPVPVDFPPGTQVVPTDPRYRPQFKQAKDTSDGVMIALYPDDDTAEDLAVDDGQDADSLHCTLVVIDSSDDVDLSRVQDVVSGIAHQHDPLDGNTSGAGRFNAGDGPGGAVDVALVDCPGLERLRQDIFDGLEAAGVPMLVDHGYTPHITLQYGNDGDAPDVASVPLNFDQVCVVAGDTIVARYNLDATKRLLRRVRVKRARFTNGNNGNGRGELVSTNGHHKV